MFWKSVLRHRRGGGGGGAEGGGSLTTLTAKYIMTKFVEISELSFVKVKSIWIA